MLENVLQISNKSLHLLNRVYGNTGSDTGESAGGTRLEFADGDIITAIKATVQVNNITAAGCSTNPTTNTRTRARLGGRFFNTGVPTPGSSLNDVFAFVGIQLRSDSTDKPGTLEVIGRVVKCNDSSCFTNTKLDQQTLGAIKVKKKADLSIQWDKTNHQFIFQFGKLAPVISTYTVPDTSPAGDPTKGLDLNHRIANCTVEPRPVAFVDVSFDNVLVNQSAAP